MKLSAETVEVLAGYIAPLDTPGNREKYRSGNFPRADRVKDLDRRYRWDLLNATVAARVVCDIYEDANATHIDTALRRIVEPLGRPNYKDNA